MTVDTFVTNDINYGSLYQSVYGNTAKKSTGSFNYGDVVSFEWSSCGNPASIQAEQRSFNGWFVFDANDATFHRTRLPMDFYSGHSYTTSMSLNMLYTSSVIVVLEVT